MKRLSVGGVGKWLDAAKGRDAVLL